MIMSGLCVPANGLYDAFSYRQVYTRYLECRQNKRNKANALQFEIDAEENILKLQRSLEDRSYRPSRSILFATTKPKLREIFASNFTDRVVHHILVKELEKIWEPIFVHDSYSCRRGKGTHKAVVQLHKFLRQASCNGNLKCYYLQLDIKDFFQSINKDILFNLLKQKISDPKILWLTQVILFWDCTKSYSFRGNKRLLSFVPQHKSLFGKDNQKGLPLGNLTSQFFANVYLNELDKFVKHTLKAQYYLRYVDDFVIVATDIKRLEIFKAQIEQFLSNRLDLRVHPSRQKLLPISNGIDFLGYIVRPNYVLVRRRVINSFKQKVKRAGRNVRNVADSYFGHFQWANSFRLLHNFLQHFKEDA